MRTTFVWIAAVLSLAALVVAGCGPQSAGTSLPSETSEQPGAVGEVRIATPGEVSKALSAGKGKVTVLNLWATWCPPCVAELPHFAEFYEKHVPGDVNLVMLSLDDSDKLSDVVAPFVEKHELPFPVLVMEKGHGPDAVEGAIGAPVSGAIPTTYVYNAQGEVVQTFDGAVTLAELEAALTQAQG